MCVNMNNGLATYGISKSFPLKITYDTNTLDTIAFIKSVSTELNYCTNNRVSHNFEILHIIIAIGP